MTIDKVLGDIIHYLILYKVGEYSREQTAKNILSIKVEGTGKTIKEVIEGYEKH